MDNVQAAAIAALSDGEQDLAPQTIRTVEADKRELCREPGGDLRPLLARLTATGPQYRTSLFRR